MSLSEILRCLKDIFVRFIHRISRLTRKIDDAVFSESVNKIREEKQPNMKATAVNVGSDDLSTFCLRSAQNHEKNKWKTTAQLTIFSHGTTTGGT